MQARTRALDSLGESMQHGTLQLQRLPTRVSRSQPLACSLTESLTCKSY